MLVHLFDDALKSVAKRVSECGCVFIYSIVAYLKGIVKNFFGNSLLFIYVLFVFAIFKR